MDTNMQTPKVTKESKNKIRVEFDRAPLKERLKAKFLNLYFFQKIIWAIFRYALLVGISYVVLFPFISKIAGSFMSKSDIIDVTVRLIPKAPTLEIYEAVFTEMGYWKAFAGTFALSLVSALLQTFICCLIAYGLAKFRFRGNSLIMMLVILTMIVPHQTLRLSMSLGFRYFDIFGIVSFLSGGANISFLPADAGLNEFLASIQIIKLEEHGINLMNTYWPMVILSASVLYRRARCTGGVRLHRRLRRVPHLLYHHSPPVHPDDGNGVPVLLLLAVDRRLLYGNVLHHDQDQDAAESLYRRDSEVSENRLRRTEYLLFRNSKHLRSGDHYAPRDPVLLWTEVPCPGY